jgi:hypothetical protein
MKIKLICQFCSISFFKWPSYLKNRSGKFCSKRCDLSQRSIEWKQHNPNLDRDLTGENNPMFGSRPWNYREEGAVRADGYMRVTVDGRRILKHRHIMAMKLGRPLNDDEIVHHIDGDNTNNDPENLTVMSQSEHFTLHIKEWDDKHGTGWRRGEPNNNPLSASHVGKLAA